MTKAPRQISEGKTDFFTGAGLRAAWGTMTLYSSFTLHTCIRPKGLRFKCEKLNHISTKKKKKIMSQFLYNLGVRKPFPTMTQNSIVVKECLINLTI